MQEQFKTPEIRDISELTPYHNNPRQNEGAIEELAKIIQENGFLVPLVVDKDLVLITGHTRLLAMQHLGMTKAQIIIADHLTPAQVQAFRLADNRVAENSKWDEAKLSEELRQLSDMGFDLGFTGFSQEELDCLCGSIDATCLDDMDYASVCGTVSPTAVTLRDNVMLSIGNYKLHVPIKVYKEWEVEMLTKYPTRAEMITALVSMLGFPESKVKTDEQVKAEIAKGADAVDQAAPEAAQE